MITAIPLGIFALSFVLVVVDDDDDDDVDDDDDDDDDNIFLVSFPCVICKLGDNNIYYYMAS